MTTESVLSESRLRSFKAQALGNGRRPALTPIELSLVQQAYAYALQSPEVQRLREDRDVLIRNGFVRCDIPACNCGSWHARYGLPERMFEIKEALADAGHPLCNDNGNLVSNALAALIADRDALREDAARYRWLRNDDAQYIATVRIYQHIIGSWSSLTQDELDNAIDAAMEKKP